MELNIYSLDVRICNYALDNNGNMIQRSNTTLDGTYRRCCWDEENRLMAVTDFRNGNPSIPVLIFTMPEASAFGSLQEPSMR